MSCLDEVLQRGSLTKCDSRPEVGRTQNRHTSIEHHHRTSIVYHRSLTDCQMVGSFHSPSDYLGKEVEASRKRRTEIEDLGKKQQERSHGIAVRIRTPMEDENHTPPFEAVSNSRENDSIRGPTARS